MQYQIDIQPQCIILYLFINQSVRYNNKVNNKMDIDFNSLSFKITKPAFEPKNSDSLLGPLNKYKIQQYLGHEDTQASQCQQQTIDPFRRTFHLFKHVEKQKRNQSQQKTKMQKTLSFNTQSDIIANPTDNQTVYSLENFDSFKNYDSKAEILQSKQIKAIKNQYNQSSYIKIENQCELSDEFSLIMDDLSYQIRSTDNRMENDRRIKTEHNQEKQKVAKGKKQNNGFFCLTAQEESSTQSNLQNIKEFYFDLRDSKQAPQGKSLHSIDYPAMKKQIKYEIYKFIDELEIMSQRQIDEAFLQRLRECFSRVKREEHEIKVQKWCKKANKGENTEKKGGFQLYEAAKTYQLNQKKNKENKMMCKNMDQRPKVYKANPKIAQTKLSNQKEKKKWF